MYATREVVIENIEKIIKGQRKATYSCFITDNYSISAEAIDDINGKDRYINISSKTDEMQVVDSVAVDYGNDEMLTTAVSYIFDCIEYGREEVMKRAGNNLHIVSIESDISSDKVSENNSFEEGVLNFHGYFGAKRIAKSNYYTCLAIGETNQDVKVIV